MRSLRAAQMKKKPKRRIQYTKMPISISITDGHPYMFAADGAIYSIKLRVYGLDAGKKGTIVVMVSGDGSDITKEVVVSNGLNHVDWRIDVLSGDICQIIIDSPADNDKVGASASFLFEMDDAFIPDKING